jgi:hypothetical protein
VPISAPPLLTGRSQFGLLTPSTVVGTGSDTLVEGALVRIMGSGRVRGRIWPQGAGAVGQFGLPDVIHCAGALGTSALGDEAELGSLARWRIRFASA